MRSNGYRVTTRWIRTTMSLYCKKFKAKHTCLNGTVVLYDDKVHTFGKKWCSLMMKRHQISVQRRTNKKPKSSFGRMHRVQNYHYYTVYLMALEPPGQTHDRGSDFGHDLQQEELQVLDQMYQRDFHSDADETEDEGISEFEDGDGYV